MDEDLLYGLLHDLLDCACAALATTERGCPDNACVVPGAVVIEDDCCKGQLRVLAERIYPTIRFPEAAEYTPCGLTRLAMDVLVSLRHCAPGAACKQQDANAKLILEEGTVLWRAMACCLERASDVIDGHLLGMTPPPGTPNSGCVGWDLRLTIGVNVGCGCEQIGLG